MKYSKEVEKRIKIVNYVYYFELMEKELNDKYAFETGNFSEQEIKEINSIAKNYEKFQKMIVKFIKEGWNWKRLSPYVRAILIYGSFEFFKNDKKLVINELVNLTKLYAPDDSYKIVNGLLDKVGTFYEKIKQNKKRTED